MLRRVTIDDFHRFGRHQLTEHTFLRMTREATETKILGPFSQDPSCLFELTAHLLPGFVTGNRVASGFCMKTSFMLRKR